MGFWFGLERAWSEGIGHVQSSSESDRTSHVYREGSACADKLASRRNSLSDDIEFFSEPPSLMKECPERDFAGSGDFRFSGYRGFQWSWALKDFA
ncbi:hypothetical protein NC651_020519 [Populus alba x Populus x berolinensis]|nr:hypothetical protein NC651_020519 [Populus alba x Populus x berolinensis]